MSLPRLYAILDLGVLHSRQLQPIEVLDAWLGAGVRLVQLRAKNLAMGPFLDLAEAMLERARPAGARLVINDRADVARLAAAAGVHLGQNDLSPADARRLLLPEQLIGLSAHDIDQVGAALEAEADYVAIGPVFDTPTKARPDPTVGLSVVRDSAAAAHQAGRPLVAIGGITLESAPAVIAAGADSVAVISDLLVEDWRTRAGDYFRALSGSDP